MKTKYWWCYLIAAVVLINYLASLVHFRVDLTAEKRYTLGAPTKQLLRGLNDRVSIDVDLAGHVPADCRQRRPNAAEG